MQPIVAVWLLVRRYHGYCAGNCGLRTLLPAAQLVIQCYLRLPLQKMLVHAPIELVSEFVELMLA